MTVSLCPFDPEILGPRRQFFVHESILETLPSDRPDRRTVISIHFNEMWARKCVLQYVTIFHQSFGPK